MSLFSFFFHMHASTVHNHLLPIPSSSLWQYKKGKLKIHFYYGVCSKGKETKREREKERKKGYTHLMGMEGKKEKKEGKNNINRVCDHLVSNYDT